MIGLPEHHIFPDTSNSRFSSFFVSISGMIHTPLLDLQTPSRFFSQSGGINGRSCTRSYGVSTTLEWRFRGGIIPVLLFCSSMIITRSFDTTLLYLINH
mgnify:CR=1 FL=1